MRMKLDWWLDVKKFSESDKMNEIVEFILPKKDQELLKDYPEMFEQKVRCRLVKVELPDEGVEVLCTSLLDEEKYPAEDVGELYHYRWNEEEGYKLFKSRMEVEYFSGKTAWAVKQDFFAKIFILSLCANLAFPIEEKVKKEYCQGKPRKYNQKINRTGALSMTRNICIGLFIKKIIEKALKAFDSIVLDTREIVRPGHKEPRKHHQKRLYHMNYKRLLLN